jgi:RNA polymerase sigma factor (sigma-70 family)
MSYEIAGRRSWLVSWLDHWRGHAYANDTVRNITKRASPRAWVHWLQNVSHDAPPECPSVDEELISQSLAARHLRQSVEQLPSHERQVLLLHVNNGLTYWEIAARLGMDEEVVLRNLAHAYSQLRLELSADELRR